MIIFKKSDPRFASGADFVKFESEEELEKFCDFLYNNDYFLRKNFGKIENYKYYISNIKGGVFIDCEYHYKLILELNKKLQVLRSIKNERKDKLIKIENWKNEKWN